MAIIKRVLMLGALLLSLPLALLAADDAETDDSELTFTQWRAAYDDDPLAREAITKFDAARTEFRDKLTKLVADGELSDEGADELAAMLKELERRYVEDWFGPPGSDGVPPARTIAAAPEVSALAEATEAAPVSPPLGVSIGLDGSVKLEGTAELLEQSGLVPVDLLADGQAVVLEFDKENAGVYIPLKVDGLSVAAGEVELEGVSDRLSAVLNKIMPEARVYTLPSKWRSELADAWQYLRSAVGAGGGEE